MLKVIIAGTRTASARHVGEALAAYPDRDRITEVVSGKCPTGADFWGEIWAQKRGLPIQAFPADWAKDGRAAGPRRNRRMAQYADALVAVWDGESRGTRNMIAEMQLWNKPVFVFRIEASAAKPAEGTEAEQGNTEGGAREGKG